MDANHHNPFLDATWVKSSHSGQPQNDCVEVAVTPDLVGIRDSKNPDAGHIAVPVTAWAEFLDFVRQL